MYGDFDQEPGRPAGLLLLAIGGTIAGVVTSVVRCPATDGEEPALIALVLALGVFGCGAPADQFPSDMCACEVGRPDLRPDDQDVVDLSALVDLDSNDAGAQ